MSTDDIGPGVPRSPSQLTLYRVLLFESTQVPMFGPRSALDRPALIRSALERKPRIQVGEHVWQVGNPGRSGPEGFIFRIGRDLTQHVATTDDAGDFHDQDLDVFSYAHCVMDLTLGVVAISQAKNLSSKTSAIASALQQLLQNDEDIQERELTVEVRPIVDPTDFLNQLRSAAEIDSISITTSLPNAFDVEEDFVKPTQELTLGAGATQAVTTLKGGHIVVNEVIESVVRFASTVGNWAKAKIRREPGSALVPVTIKPDNVKIAALTDEIEKDPGATLDVLREEYARVRNANEADEPAPIPPRSRGSSKTVRGGGGRRRKRQK